MDLPELARILRENGDKVLNADSKLSLSTSLLKDLNDSFTLIVDEREALNSTFQVIGTSSSKIELLFDLQFLHDFIQRSVSLKLVPPTSFHEPVEQIDIRKFKNLKLLELRKIPIHQVIGLQSIRTQLQYIICIRCISCLRDIFIDCGGDKSEKFVWCELKEAVLSYNNLSYIDNSFEYVPWLQSLDLSHNRIINAQAIDCLPNLKHLNLSFNLLEAVPLFSKDLSRKLQVLLLNNNYIEDLTGLCLLDNLVTLDLSCNCLVDHLSLNTLSQLVALQWFSLDGNPLSFHPQHRILTAQRLHTNTASVKFLLDNVLLSKSERLLVGSYRTVVSRTPAASQNGHHLERDHLSSISSTTSVVTHISDITTVPSSELLSRSQISRRSGKVRKAIITESIDTAEINNADMTTSVASVESLETSTEHLETKKQIEILRSKYGESWLKSVGGSLVQDVLGMPKNVEANLSSSPYENDFKLYAAEVLEKPKDVSPINSDIVKDSDNVDVVSDLSTNNIFLTASESSLYEGKDETIESDPVTTDEEEVESSGEEHLYLAQLQCNETDTEEVFLMITDKYFKERDTTNGHVKCKWLLDVILSCERLYLNPPTVCLEFDTVRRNMKHREYILDQEEVQKFVHEISEIIDKRSLKEMNQTVFNCMKCSCQFSLDVKSLRKMGLSKKVPECPSCSSTLVVEVDECTSVKVDSQNVPYTKQERADSPSECSIASETENGPLAQICVTAEVHRDSQEITPFPTDCSATSVQESGSSRVSTDDNFHSDVIRRCESDIEVISNPSQSSIEVLDEHARPGRKRSSEERKLLPVPTLVPIPDVVTTVISVPVFNLTESSSSSSFTESVCTAYDGHTAHGNSRATSGLEASAIQEEDTVKRSATVIPTEKNKSRRISSILEGLFSGATTGTKSVTISPTDELDEIKFVFSENFSTIDHRIKLHLYQHVFEVEQEEFVWILKCSLLRSGASQTVSACLVLSTQKVYILHITSSKLGENISEWLIKKDSYTIDRLQSIFALPWKQGIGIEIKSKAPQTLYHLCILQDVQRTSNFLTYLASNPLPQSCDLISVAPERIMMKLQQFLLSLNIETTKSASVCLFSIYSNCVIVHNEDTKELAMGIFLVTNDDLILIQDLTWLLPDSNNIPVVFKTQPISNLLEVDCEVKIIDFHFLDEVNAYEEIWTVKWETEDSMNTVISAVRSPWEQIFSVPLQVNHKVYSA